MSGTRLLWCVGKFTFCDSSMAPVHGLALPDFLLDSGLDLSAIVALRDGRAGQDSYAVDQPDITDWLERSGGPELVSVVSKIPIADGMRLHIIDLLPGAGMMFELFKSTSKFAVYAAAVVDKEVPAFDALHLDDEVSYRIGTSVIDSNDYVSVQLVNHLHMVRHGVKTANDVLSHALRGQGRTVLAARLFHGSGPTVTATTVGGEVVAVPSLESCLKAMVEHDSGWLVKWVAGFDAGYFLPTVGAVAGALFASNAGGADGGDDFVDANVLLKAVCGHDT